MEIYPNYFNEIIQNIDMKPKIFNQVCVIFIDIVDYTIIVKNTLDLIKIKTMLDLLFELSDKLVIKHKIFKLETIGDAYVCIGGLYLDSPDFYSDTLNFCIELINNLDTIINPLDQNPIKIRIGIASGNILFNLSRHIRPRITCIGNCMNLAARLQSCAKPNEIICSENFYLNYKNKNDKISFVHFLCDIKSFGLTNMYLVKNNISLTKSQELVVYNSIQEKKLYIDLLLKVSILIIDDSNITLKILTRLFKKFNLNITTVNCPEKSIELFNNYKFDVVITDIDMPIINGYELAKKLNIINDKTIIIYMSAYENILTSNNENKFVDFFITKPIRDNDIINIIKYIKPLFSRIK